MAGEGESRVSEEGFENESAGSTTTIFYNSEDYVSKPKRSDGGTVAYNILEFHHSFGYDCRKRFNLCVADPETLIFASGNLIHFLNLSENKISFRRCSTGGGIGHITKNPTFNHIAIGENGVNPPIIIYEWPSMEIVTVLRQGTTRSYSHLRYSPDGLQLVSQGGDPDYLITVWDWQRSKIALQCKSHGQDVFNVVFSSTMPEHMTSCGSGHIKSWKMSKTFTGLKLQGELGRFGKTEISDIVGVYPMPDEKIISGCEWGNILVWDEGLIKIEVCRKKNRPCHSSYISQFEYINGELISVGTDGFIHVWYYETIDQAEPSEDTHLVEVEPIYELSIGAQTDGKSLSRTAMLMQIQKKDPSDPDNSHWYAQDGNGGIWLIDLSTLQTPKPSQRLLTCHAGSIVDMDVADWGPYVATIGQDGCVHLYDYQKKNLVLTHQFRDNGCCIIWLPCSVEPSGTTVVCAFETGVIRMISINLQNLNQKVKDGRVKLTQALKPHTMKITRMSMNSLNSLLVTGSEDLTLFVFHIQVQESYPELVPIGYVEVPSCVTFITWKPNFISTILVGCSRGECVQVDLPTEPQTYTTVSYKLSKCKPMIFKFESVKSSIIRENVRLENEARRQQKIAEKKEELRQMKVANPALEIDEIFCIEADLEEDHPLPEIYVPEVPNSVLIAFYTTKDTILLSMSGYDAGYVYEYTIPEPDKEAAYVRSNLVIDCDDEEIRSFLFYNERKYIIFGIEKGEIRVCKINSHDESDFSDYWTLTMHDNFNGCIPSMRLSYDKKMLLTCGHDGNIFSFIINDESFEPEKQTLDVKSTAQIPALDFVDIEDLDHPSLEQVIIQAENNRIMAEAKNEKDKTMATLRELTEEYNFILKRNNSLPISQRLTDEELELDPRITADLKQQLQAEMDIVHKKLAYNAEKCKLRLKKLMDHFIEPITCLPFAVKKILKPNAMVYSLRELKLTGDYAIERVDTARKFEDLCQDDRMKRADDQQSVSVNESSRIGMDLNDENADEGPPKLHGMESFLKGLSPRTVQFQLGDEINQMLKKYRALKAKLEEQEEEWKILQSQRPDPKAINPEDERAIEHAKATIGDYKLKASLNLDENLDRRPTVRKKYKQIIDCRRRIHFRREDFNDKLRNLRTKKVELQKEVEQLIKKLKNIHAELPDKWIQPLPDPPIFDYDIEFPEKNLELESYTSMAERVKEMKKKRQSVMLDLPVEDFDEEYEILLMDETRFQPGKSLNVIGDEMRKNKFPEEMRAIRVTVSPDVLAALERAEKVDSKLEREMKRVRAARKTHEQEEILRHIRKSYEAFDEELDELEKERLEIVYESVYMDLYLLTMHQELIVLKRFEGMENELSQKVEDKSKTKAAAKSKVKKLSARIEEKNHHITKLQEKIRDNLVRYLHSISEDKYYHFLKRICKKKYKPPKADDASSSSDSSSSESSSDDGADDDSASDDSRNVGLLHLDESVCPEGCDRDLYDDAFAIREKRYEMEQRIRDEQRIIETLQKDLELQKKKMKTIEIELKTDREKLDAFLREKQRQLNDIDVTIILKLHQLQCFTDADKAENIQNCIVFDKTRLSQLYARVGELQQETADQLTKHKNDKVHLQKIKSDCESMKKELESLKKEIKKEMEQKFGQQVSLVTLYEAVLRRLIYDIKANTGSMIKFYDEKIKSVKQEYKQQLQVLKNLIQDNTEKLSFLTVLEEELLKLRKTLNVKPVSEEEINRLESQYEADLARLKSVLRNQKKQKEWICRDIRSLSNKSKNLLPLDQSKLGTSTDKRRPTLTLFDGTDKDVFKYQMQENYSKDDTSTSDGARELLMEDSDYYKKIIAVRHLLTQITTSDDVNVRETIEKMLREISENLQNAGYSEEQIHKNINDIMKISHDGQDSYQVSNKDYTIESLSDIIYRYSTELRESVVVQEIKQEVRDNLEDLFSNVGIQNDRDHIAQGVVTKLKATRSISSALTYLLQQLPLDTDSGTKAALRKHIRQSLIEIMKHIEIELGTIKTTEEF
ncbi:cilia- and flagella-associated protein 44 isoform X2 [Nasonia vitripennis]|uniref:WD repeat-containing protein 52 n=1 Tax=Nasonia vitripennis TaxID=7425 RepID=A0A7M7H3S0_NASVI|nr:cilia- and flagella-associated protein 44 isoform X2 [Nasonia vitripennis]